MSLKLEGAAAAAQYLTEFVKNAKWTSVQKFIGRVCIAMLGVLVMSFLTLYIKGVWLEILAL